MRELTIAREKFLKKVEEYASGQAVRFALPLDELINWSMANGLEFTVHTGVHDVVKFTAGKARMPFWAGTPRNGDGAKLSLLADARFPEPLRAMARNEFAEIEGKPVKQEGVPEIPFTNLIWVPYRTRVLDLMTRLLEGVLQPAEAKAK